MTDTTGKRALVEAQTRNAVSASTPINGGLVVQNYTSGKIASLEEALYVIGYLMDIIDGVQDEHSAAS